MHIRIAGSLNLHRDPHLEPLGSRTLPAAAPWDTFLPSSDVSTSLSARHSVSQLAPPRSLFRYLPRNYSVLNTQLRKTIRQKRRNITDAEKDRCGKQLTQICIDDAWLTDSQHIACFLDSDGEIATDALIKQLLTIGKSVYLPILNPDKANTLLFARYQAGDKLIPNKFGILEPDLAAQAPIDTRTLDLVLMPLVVFDHQGNRLGMGGGYYDRTFSYLLDQNFDNQGIDGQNIDSENSRPRLAGLAYSFQQVDQLKPAAWDVPLEKVFTELSVVSVSSN